MSNLLKSKFLLGVMTVAIMFVGAVAVATTASAYVQAETLRQGSTGPQVASLQQALGITADGKFGPMTKAAVMSFQASVGLTADGVVGPMTGAVLSGGMASGGNYPAGCSSTSGYSSTTGQPCSGGSNLPAGCSSTSGYSVTTGMSCAGGSSNLPAGCSSTSGFSPTTGASCSGGSTPSNTGPLAGGAGDITVSSLSTYSGEKVKAGENDIKVLGFQIEADNGSDVSIDSVKIELKQTDTDSSQRITDYADEVSVWMGSTKVGSDDTADFSETSVSDVYTKSVSLSGAVIRAGEKAKFYVALSATSNLDSGDIDDENFSIDVLSTRFTDAEGVTTTNTDAVTNREADFEDLVTSGDIEVKITKNSASPEARSIQVDDTTNTPDVLLLAVDMKATNSDITIDQLSFNITPTGADANAIVNEYKLLLNGVEIDAISATAIDTATTEEIVFTDLDDDFTITDGDTAVIKLVADILDTGEASFSNGDSILASLTNTNLLAASSTIKDENGDTVAAGDRVGAVTGKTQGFYVDGIGVSAGTITEVVSDTSTTETNDRGTYTVKFTVAAFGAAAYVDSQSASGTTDGVQWSVTGDTFTGTDSSDVTCTPNCTVGTGNYLVEEGTTKTFTLTVVLVNTAGTAGFYGIQIDEIGIGAADDATAETTVTTGLDDLETDRINLET